MNKVVHFKREPYDVYIGRPSLYGNPWSHKKDSQAEFRVKTRNDSIECYRRWLLGTDFKDVLQEKRQQILDSLPSLQGKTLGCWCSPFSCHGDVLADLVILRCDMIDANTTTTTRIDADQEPLNYEKLLEIQALLPTDPIPDPKP